MKTIRDFLTVAFRDLSPQDILHKVDGTTYKNLNTPLVKKLMEQRMKQYSIDEIDNIYNYFFNLASKKKVYDGAMYTPKDTHTLNIFALLSHYVYNILTTDGNNIYVQYRKLLHWKDLSAVLSEDILVCSFLARYDRNHGITKRNWFGWPNVLGHDNREINTLLKDGIAENHYHLKGSASLFYITWDFFMNDFFEDRKTQFEAYEGMLKDKTIKFDCLNEDDDRNHFANLKVVEKSSRNATFFVSPEQQTLPLYKQLILARIIRRYLELQIQNPDPEEKVKDKIDSFFKIINKLKLKEGPAYYDKILKDQLIGGKANETCDYSFLFDAMQLSEREFLYHCFSKQFSTAELPFGPEEKKLFYVYLLIQNRLRAEFLQINKEIPGFANFLLFEKRKDVFIHKDVDTKNLSIKQSLSLDNLRYLEARIAPRKGTDDYVKYIKIAEKGLSAKDLDKIRYIVHFIKQSDLGKDIPDKKPYQGVKYDYPLYRHFFARDTYRWQADNLIDFRNDKRARVYSDKIIGIDACNKEIGCRPEVFGPVFRRLVTHNILDSVETNDGNDLYSGERYRLSRLSTKPVTKQLRVTYHVGEDFLDIADGLRAIAEAIHFLNLKNGDRLGHAIALGIDVESWYAQKQVLYLPAQDYLDNVVWLYYALTSYNIPKTDHLKTYLNDEFKKYFEIIYNQHLIRHSKNGKRDIDSIYQEAVDYYTQKNGEPLCEHWYSGDELNFDIFNYYRSWQLRGDDPECYYNGFFQMRYIKDHTSPTPEFVDFTVPKDKNTSEDHKLFSENQYRINYHYPEDFQTRYVPEPAILYYAYHYNEDIKKEGEKTVRIEVSPEYIRAVKLVQKELQKDIARLGIAIETNPTSNYLISSFNQYDSHPIINLFNKGLTEDPKELAECPQLCVSINTDDQGIFAIRLDNEYALMALALERATDENGNPKYKKINIYHWLDEVRRMGIRQSFIYQEEKN